MTIANVSRYLRRREIPPWLVEIWKKEQYYHGDPHSDYRNELAQITKARKLYGSGLGCIGLCAFGIGNLVLLSGLGLILIPRAIGLIRKARRHNKELRQKGEGFDGNGHRCFHAIARLFVEFGITPSKKIGKYGYEEFCRELIVKKYRESRREFLAGPISETEECDADDLHHLREAAEVFSIQVDDRGYRYKKTR